MFLFEDSQITLHLQELKRQKPPAPSNMMITRGLGYAQKIEAVATATVKQNQNGSVLKKI